ncbi:MAG: aminoacyl-tRNA hydrolase [Kiritimatiellales bacterium]|nr:aminoacyl-tRNA hydrolase [Kiritimatiellales bacterium]
MKLVVGLGNPGKEYESTRHNLGYLAVDELARRQGRVFKRSVWFPAWQVKGRIGPEKARLIKLATYMNHSGLALKSVMRMLWVRPKDVIVLYDDVDLEWGRIRLRSKGSAGSHNGMRSVIDWLGTEAFCRVRIGIGPKPAGEDMVDFVLGRFSEKESFGLEKIVEYAADAVESVFAVGIEQTMSEFNQSR